MSLLLLGQQNTLAQQVAALFPDVWYDPSDLTTLFQDSAGTTPVTAVEQPVGLMLDKSRGLVLGSELASASFTDTATWLDVVSNITNRTATSFTTSGTGGVQLGGSGSIVQNNKRYRIAITWSKSDSTTAFSVRAQTGIDAVSSTAASGVFLLNENVANGTIYLRLAAAATVTISSISVRELPGNHAYHTPGDTTTRPTYSRRINQLTYTEDFSNAAWPKVGCAATASKLTEDSTNGVHVLNRAGATSGVATVFMVQAKAAERSQIALQLGSSAAYYNLATGQVISGAGASMVSAGDGWYWCVFSGTPVNTNSLIYLASGGTASYQGDGTSGVFLRYASLVPADLAALPYQRVNTATDYDATPSIFPAYLRCDGVNDGMQTNSIDFTATDKMFVSAGVRKLSDAAAGVLAELSADRNANNGAFTLSAPSGSAINYAFFNKGTTSQFTSVDAAAPNTKVVTGIGDISGDSVILRFNGSQVANNTNDQGTGNYGNYPLYLFRRGGSTLPFNGWFYGAVIKAATLTAAQIALVERYLAGKTKTVVLA